jgi:GGDEF domain-containing protein
MIDIEKNDLPTTMARGLLLLLEAMALHAIEYDYEECSAYQRRIREIRDKLENTTDNRDVLVLVGEAIRLLQSHSHLLEAFNRAQASEKQSIIHLMTESLLKVSGRSESTAQELRSIEYELGKASRIGDIHALRTKLSKCLGVLYEESKSSQGRVQGGEKELGPYDQVTGLPGLAHAKARVAELAAAKTISYVVVLVLRNLNVLNRRLGFLAGDRALKLFGQQIARRLSGTDMLFRWRGPCFIVAFSRTGGAESVRVEASKLGSISIEQTVEEDRSFFKISAAWTVLPITNVVDVTELLMKIDVFVTEQAP